MSGSGAAKRILVAVDLSDGSRRALVRAIDIADALDADVFVVHAVDTSAFYGLGHVSWDVAGVLPDLLARGRRELLEFVNGVDPERRRVRWAEVVEGAPATSIAECARDKGASLVVVGTHDRGAVSRFFLGSVAEAVARRAPCDVLVVRGGDEKEPAPR